MTARSWPAQVAPASAQTLKEVLAAGTAALLPDALSAGTVEVSVQPDSGVPVFSGTLPEWDDVVAFGHAAAQSWLTLRGDSPSDIVVDIEPLAPQPEGVRVPKPPLRTVTMVDSADAVVIGAGICGMMTAWYLQRAGLDVVVVEAGYSIGEGTTSWNNGMVHPGSDPKPGTLKAELNIKGNAAWSDVMARLGIPFERIPAIVASFEEADVPRLEADLEKAKINGVPGVAHITAEQIMALDPRFSDKVLRGVVAPSTASVEPVLVAQTIAHEFRRQGGHIYLAAPVSSIDTENRHVAGVTVLDHHIASPLVVNVAGVYADLVAATAGSRRYSIHPRKGTLILFRPAQVDPYRTTVGSMPGPYSKGGGMTGRPHGLTTGGPTAIEQQSRVALPPTQAEIDHILTLGARIYPNFPFDDIIHIGSEVRAVTYCEDFIVGPAPGLTGLVDVAGTQSPGIASAPAIAQKVCDELAALGWLDG